MDKPYIERLWISREARLATIVAVLCAVGTLACVAGHWEIGIAVLGVALAIVAAFWFAVVKPARIPHDAVVVIRLAGPIEEDVTRSPIDQLLRRGG
ncbi:MAG TPA: hypothetical protein VGR40_07085, partial [Candidatus Binatus sp.]|nr:hypothetical protein [Candidatus Binatus sp.]